MATDITTPAKANPDAHGNDIPRGGSIVDTIDLTPTWRGVMPILLFALRNGTEEGQRLAEVELMRLADIADTFSAERSKQN